jgi:hypothetical protein
VLYTIVGEVIDVYTCSILGPVPRVNICIMMNQQKLLFMLYN